MGPTVDEVSPVSKKHLENARMFVLVLLLLVLIAGANLTWACLSISSTVRSQATAMRSQVTRYQAAAFVNHADLALRSYLLNGDFRQLATLDESRNGLRELVAANKDLQVWSDKEERWYHDFAQPLIQGRHKVDEGHMSVAELQILYLQMNPGQHENDFRNLVADDVNVTLDRKPWDEDRSPMVAVRIVVAIAICLAGVLVAALSLRHIASLGKTV